MKKICYIVTLPITIRAFFIPQLKALSEAGMEVSVICSNDDNLQKLLGENINYIPVNIPRGIALLPMLRATRKLCRILKNDKFDLVQFSTPNAALCAAIASRLEHVKIRNYHLMGLRYLGEHGIKRLFLKGLEKITCNLATNIECVSSSNLQMAVEEKLFPLDKGTVIWNGSSGGIDLERFDYKKRDLFRKEIREKCGIEEEEFVYIFAGRITKDKGVNELFEAFFKLTQGRLLMVGKVEEISNLNFQLYNKALSDKRIIFVQPTMEIEKYYCAADVLVLPSYREGFGNVVIEAAAMGTPAIVSKIPGPIDTSVENVTAFWITPHDSQDLLKAMLKSQSQKKMVEDMGKNAIKYVTKSFDQNLLNLKIEQRKKELLGIEL